MSRAEAAERAAAPSPLTSEEARQQARAEGLTLGVADNKAGYFGVSLNKSSKKPFVAQVKRGGKEVYLGSFATAEEAALCIARSPEGQAAAERAAASAEGQGRAPAMPSGAVLKEEGTVPPMPLGAFVKEEEVAPPIPPGAFFKEEGAVPPMPLGAFVKDEGVAPSMPSGAFFKDEEVVPPMPPDAVVKREQEVIVKEEERSGDRPKRRRSN